MGAKFAESALIFNQLFELSSVMLWMLTFWRDCNGNGFGKRHDVEEARWGIEIDPVTFNRYIRGSGGFQSRLCIGWRIFFNVKA